MHGQFFTPQSILTLLLCGSLDLFCPICLIMMCLLPHNWEECTDFRNPLPPLSSYHHNNGEDNVWGVPTSLRCVNQLPNLITHRKWHQFDLWPLIMVRRSISTNWCYVSLLCPGFLPDYCSVYETLCVKIISFVFIWGCKNIFWPGIACFFQHIHT